MVKVFEYLRTRLDSDKMSADAKIKASPTDAGVLLSRAYTIVVDMLYESIHSLCGVAHLNYLLRQQSENEYLKSKKHSILHFSLFFLIFSFFEFDLFFTSLTLNFESVA